MYKYNYTHLLFIHYIQICQKINFLCYIWQKSRVRLDLCVHILNFYLIFTHKNAWTFVYITLTSPKLTKPWYTIYRTFDIQNTSNFTICCYKFLALETVSLGIFRWLLKSIFYMFFTVFNLFLSNPVTLYADRIIKES